MKPLSGATIVGLVGRYRFKQLASSPGLRRKRVNVTRSNSGAWTMSASRPAGSFGIVQERQFRGGDQRIAPGSGGTIASDLPAALSGTHPPRR